MKIHAGCGNRGNCSEAKEQGICKICGGLYAVHSNCNSYNLDGESEICTPCWHQHCPDCTWDGHNCHKHNKETNQ